MSLPFGRLVLMVSRAVASSLVQAVAVRLIGPLVPIARTALVLLWPRWPVVEVRPPAKGGPEPPELW
jgi:hypothetical protein